MIGRQPDSERSARLRQTADIGAEDPAPRQTWQQVAA